MDIIQLLLGVIDLPSVLLAIGVTQFIKWLLPSPAGGGKFDVAPKIYRVLPLFPLIIATIIVVAKDGIFTPTMKLEDSIIRGILSGMAGSYGYRTAKVMIFGDKNGNGKTSCCKPEVKNEDSKVV